MKVRLQSGFVALKQKKADLWFCCSDLNCLDDPIEYRTFLFDVALEINPLENTDLLLLTES